VLSPLESEYDYIFLDCPPSISLVSESVFEAADALLIPVLPATLSARMLDSIGEVAGNRAQRLPFFSMVDARKRMHRDVMEAFRAERPEMLHTVVPLAADVERMGLARAPLAQFAPHGRATEAFRNLWAEVSGRLAGRAEPEAHLAQPPEPEGRPAQPAEPEGRPAQPPEPEGRPGQPPEPEGRPEQPAEP
jgi:cellulose biosynthesis protein BcsQ